MEVRTEWAPGVANKMKIRGAAFWPAATVVASGFTIQYWLIVENKLKQVLLNDETYPSNNKQHSCFHNQ